MRTREDIIRELNELSEKFYADMEKVVNNQPEETTRLNKLGFYEPKDGIDTYSLNILNEVTLLNGMSTESLDKSKSYGNSFKTREYAEAAAKRNEIRADLLRNSTPYHNDARFFHIQYDDNDDKFVAFIETDYVSITTMYFTKEKAKEMIDKHGDDLKLLNI